MSTSNKERSRCNNHVMDGEIDKVDRVSNLPDFILHQILSFLPRKDANRTCVLSERWNSIWNSFPIFDIRETNRKKAPEVMNLLEKSLHSFIGKKLRIQTFNLSVILRDHKLFSMIDPWMTLALDNGVQEILLSVSVNGTGDERRYYALPETTFVVRSIDVYSKFYSLRKLTLEFISISGDIIQKITRNCPNLEYFVLWHLFGLKTIEISKLDKLEVVVIGVPRIQELERVDIDAPNLKQFRLRSYVLRLPCSVNLTSCHHLKQLVLGSCRITDDSLHSHLSRFPLLENLDIVDCLMLRRIRISAQRLKRLALRPGENIEVIEIDAPTLLSFRFTAYNMPVLFSENVPCPMEIKYSMLTQIQTFSSWFLDLRKFLGATPQRKHLRLMIGDNEVTFDLEELGDGEISPVVPVDCLELDYLFVKKEVDCESLIDGLLWSCHPKTISVPSHSMFRKNCVEFLYKRLLDREQPVCCSSSRMKCWRHDLKVAKIEKFGGIKDNELLDGIHVLDKLSSIIDDQEVRFQLEWDFARHERRPLF